MIVIQADAAAAADTAIAGLPADVLAELAREALHGGQDRSDAAIAQLATLTGGGSGGDASLLDGPVLGASQLDASLLDKLTSASASFESVTSDYLAAQDPWFLILAMSLFSGALLYILIHERRAPAVEGHGRSPHRLAYAEAVTVAAQLLAKGEDRKSVARASGLARDVVGVVSSRRLISPPPAGRSSATERSSGRKARGSRATRWGKILK